jgi:hypothetical protein
MKHIKVEYFTLMFLWSGYITKEQLNTGFPVFHGSYVLKILRESAKAMCIFYAFLLSFFNFSKK